MPQCCHSCSCSCSLARYAARSLSQHPCQQCVKASSIERRRANVELECVFGIFCCSSGSNSSSSSYTLQFSCSMCSREQLPASPAWDLWKRARCPLSAPSLPARVASAGNSTIIIDFELCLTRNVDSDSDCNDGDVGADIALSRSRAFFFRFLLLLLL